MTPQNPTDAAIQASMYVAGTAGSYFTWINDARIFSGIIALLTVTLLVTNIILNIKKIRQFGRAGNAKPIFKKTKQ